MLVSEGVEERIGRLVLASCEAFDNYPLGILGRALAQAASLPGGLYLAFQPLRARPSFPKSCRDFPNGALRLTTSRRAVGGDIYDFIELPDGGRFSFELEPFAKHCLLSGVDQLGFLVQHEKDISAFETKRAA